MIEWLAVLFGSILVALSAVLGVTAWSASRRFEEGRFALIAVTFFLLCLTGVMSLIDELTDIFDEQFAVEPAPLALIVISLILLYLGILRAPRPNVPPEHG